MTDRLREQLRVPLEDLGIDTQSVRLDELAHARGLVVRVDFGRHVEGVGATAIVKRRDPATEIGLYAETNLATERTALELIERSGVDVAPRLLGGSPEAGYLVLSDVGAGIESLLFGSDPDPASDSLIELATTTARLHQTPLDPGAFAGIDTWTIGGRDEWHQVVTACADLGFSQPPSPAASEQAELADELRHPAEVALVHGDLGPNNAVIDSGGTCRLVDFEGSGFQHVGLDIAMLRFPFAWYGKWAPLPRSIQQRMEGAYRRELGWTNRRVDEAIAVGAMAMALMRLERLPRIAEPDQDPALALRRRSQIVATIETAADACDEARRFPALTGWLRLIAKEMRDRWNEARQTLDTYPAFR